MRHEAQRCYRQNIYARHWFEQFFAAENDDIAYAHYRLFEACLDRRHALWGQEIINERQRTAAAARLSHIDASLETRRNRLKKDADNRKKTLYHTPTVPYLAPWF